MKKAYTDVLVIMHPRLLFIAFGVVVSTSFAAGKCASISAMLSTTMMVRPNDCWFKVVSHTSSFSHASTSTGHSHSHSHSSGRPGFTRTSRTTSTYAHCSTEHGCTHTQHQATAGVRPSWYITTLSADPVGREVDVERPRTTVVSSARHTIVSGSPSVGGNRMDGMLVPVHRVAESPGAGFWTAEASAGGSSGQA